MQRLLLYISSDVTFRCMTFVSNRHVCTYVRSNKRLYLSFNLNPYVFA